MISIDDALWLRSMGVADADIKAHMTTDTDTKTEQTEQTDTQTEQKTEQKEQKTEQTDTQTEQKQTGQQKTETKPTDQTTAVLMEVIKTLQLQNAKLAAGQGAGSEDKIEEALLSLI